MAKERLDLLDDLQVVIRKHGYHERLHVTSVALAKCIRSHLDWLGDMIDERDALLGFEPHGVPDDRRLYHRGKVP